jgi:hypothetical protein
MLTVVDTRVRCTKCKQPGAVEGSDVCLACLGNLAREINKNGHAARNAKR